MITEQQQREAYEFIREELRGQDWTLDVNRFFPEKGKLWAQRAMNKYGFHPAQWVPPLYTNDGQPDYNTWYYEFVPRLEAEGVHVDYNSENKDTALYCYEHGVYAVTMWKGRDLDPYAAFIQWWEAQ